MLFSFAILLLLALCLSKLFNKIKLPPLLGMLLAGVFLGPYFRDVIFGNINNEFFKSFFINDKILDISQDLRTLALIVILIRAGLGISRETLNKIGPAAVKMSVIPGLIEGLFIMMTVHYLLNFSWSVSGVLAFVIAAVSPAVIVPEMLNLKDEGYGQKKEIPTLILAGASVDDVFAITMFSSFLAISLGENVNIFGQLLKIPVSIIVGILLGVVIGLLLIRLFKKYHIRDTKKIIIFMIIAIIFNHIGELDIIPMASLLGIMSIGFIILEKNDDLAKRMAIKFNKVWILAEIILFTLIGASVKLDVVFNSGKIGILILLIGLIGRSIGVFLSLIKTDLNIKERIFCTIAYIPKATVQAAIGGIPLAKGLSEGDFILAIAVLAIVITAPIGAIGIRFSKSKLLEIN